ncbi:hypothetical protein A9958_13285 (plasmid) [Staphylococcus simulans]|uniref:S8 family serine peptidase n=1 Tax=Staphylococcus simulans TaxID=1286 RepID=UPI000D0A3AD3|nr:S8 family serine peptidase [Staphylococcus simulans]AVO03403.1 hypothetical protein BI282_13280 [Staphylococcus simulans]AVO06334.1 hypothetical protein BI283_13100 [Staphylococcus simulans]AWG19951.1 hypothetical protein A9958_13285 [Staphylococcus simulans]AWI02835.1 hypothetical protein A7X73_12820 [Staphylococcus simulans]
MINKSLKSLVFFMFLFSSFILENQCKALDTKEHVFAVKEDRYQDFLSACKKNNVTVNYKIPEINVVQIKSNDQEYQELLKGGFLAEHKIKKPENAKKVYSMSLIKKGSIIPNNNESKHWDFDLVTEYGSYFLHYPKQHNTRIAIVDSGINKFGNMRTNISKHSKNMIPKNSFSDKRDTKDIVDNTGHGTFVTSQIISETKVKGLSPNTHVGIYKATKNGGGNPLWTINGIVSATKDGMNIINISNGMYFNINNMSIDEKNIYEAYRRAINYAQHRNKVIVASAGNNGLNFNINNRQITRQDVPSVFSGVVTVNSTNKKNERSNFSNYGKGFIDISAPTGEINEKKSYGIKGYNKYGKIEERNGTSFAAPKVSAGLALIMDKYHLQNHPSIAVNILYDSASRNENYSKEENGNGILNIKNALSYP